jgi:hypothetical protein
MAEKLKAFSLTEISNIIDTVREANLTPRQAIKAILEYRVNRPNKTVLRYDSNGEIRQAHYRGKENKYHTPDGK